MNVPNFSNPEPSDGSQSNTTRRTGTAFRKSFDEFHAPVPSATPSVPPPPPPPPPAQTSETLRGKRLGEILVSMNLQTRPQIWDAEQRARLSKEYLGQHLVRQGKITPMDLCRALSIQTGLPIIALTGVEIPASAKAKIPGEIMLKHDFVPFFESPSVIRIAAKHPLTPQRVAELEKSCGKKIEIFLALDHEVENMLKKVAPPQKQKRKDDRHKTSLPVWLQLCDQFGNNLVGTLFSGQTVDISVGGFKIDAPQQVYNTLADARRKDSHIRVIITSPPFEVKVICSVRYVKKKEGQLKSGEHPCSIGLQISKAGPKEREGINHIITRVQNSAIRDRIWWDY